MIIVIQLNRSLNHILDTKLEMYFLRFFSILQRIRLMESSREQPILVSDCHNVPNLVLVTAVVHRFVQELLLDHRRSEQPSLSYIVDSIQVSDSVFQFSGQNCIKISNYYRLILLALDQLQLDPNQSDQNAFLADILKLTHNEFYRLFLQQLYLNR